MQMSAEIKGDTNVFRVLLYKRKNESHACGYTYKKEDKNIHKFVLMGSLWSSVHVSIPGEEVIQDTQRGFKVTVHNI